MKRMALGIGLAAMVAVMGLSTALAATEITAGNDVTDRQYSDGSEDFFLVVMNQPFTSDGKVDKWQIWAEKEVPVALAIFRFEDDEWSLVYERSVLVLPRYPGTSDEVVRILCKPV